MDSGRRDVDKDIVVMLEDGDNGVNMIEWWDVLGFDSDMTVKETVRMKVVGEDRVHLTTSANRCAAASLCIRYLGDEENWTVNGQQKRRRMK